MKKLKVLAIMLAMVLCLSIVALVGCNNDNEPDPKPDNSGSTEVPVVDGKVTFYFTLADGSVDIPEYGAIFYAGGLTGWATSDAPAFTKLEGKNVYYLQLAVDNTLDQYNEYQLVLGYSAASGLPADKQGVVWNDDMKSDECAAVAYPDNPKFEMADGATTVNLGTHTFSTELSAPETVSKVELRVTFSEPLGTTDEVYFMGGFNGWDAASAKATANTDRTTYSLELKDILCTDYDYKILVIPTGEGVVTKDAEGNDLGVWDQYLAEIPENAPEGAVKVMARTEISAGGSNLSVKIIKRDNNSYVDLVDTVSVAVPSDNIEVKGLDLSKATLVEGKDDEGNGNGVYTKTFSLAGTKTLKVEFKTALPEGVIVFCPGSLIDWSGNGTKMTISADRKSATLTAEVLPGEYEFKLVFFTNEAAYDGNVWAGTEYNDNGGNIKVTVEGYDDGEVALLEAAIDVPTL